VWLDGGYVFGVKCDVEDDSMGLGAVSCHSLRGSGAFSRVQCRDSCACYEVDLVESKQTVHPLRMQ
jgi:hypothetical protein